MVTSSIDIMNKMNKNQIQQGDVLITRLKTAPRGVTKTISKGRCVLAEGESTGHAHVVENDDAELIQLGERSSFGWAKRQLSPTRGISRSRWNQGYTK